MHTHQHDRTRVRSENESHADRGERRRRHHPDGPDAHATRGGRRRSHRGPGRGRAQRGDIRAACLLLLADNPMHGYQLMQAIAERTEGAWRPSPGAIYPTIAQLEDEGLVAVTPDSGRKLVELTPVGREYLTANAEAIGDPFTAITASGGGSNDLRGAVDQLHIAARTLAMTGTEAQVVAAQKILTEARRSLYLVLADVVDPAAETAAENS